MGVHAWSYKIRWDRGLRIQMSNILRITQVHLPVKCSFHTAWLIQCKSTLLSPGRTTPSQNAPGHCGQATAPGAVKGRTARTAQAWCRVATTEPWQRCDWFPQDSPHKINIINIKQSLKPSKWKIFVFSAVLTIDFQFPGSSTLTRLTIPESKAMPSIESFDLSEQQERWGTMLDHVANALASRNWQPRVVSVADSAWNTSNKHQSCCRKCQQYHSLGSDRLGLCPGEQTWNWKCPLIEKESPLQSTLALILVFWFSGV